MSSSIFPTIRGLGFPVLKRPEFRTKVQRASSGREFRAGFWSSPLWNFELRFNVLRDSPNVEVPVAPNNELSLVMGLFLSMNGSFDNFLFTDAADCSVTDHQFGTGNGSETQFQLNRSLGGFSEAVMNVNVLTNVKKAGVTQNNPANYSINSTGLVTFTAPPTGGQSLTWTGTYYFRCRFKEDDSEFEEFMYNLWTLKRCELIGSLGAKI